MSVVWSQHFIGLFSEGLKDVEGADDQDGQEQSIVVEDAEGGSLVLGNLVLLPQNPLVLFLARDLFVTSIQLEIDKWYS